MFLLEKLRSHHSVNLAILVKVAPQINPPLLSLTGFLKPGPPPPILQNAVKINSVGQHPEGKEKTAPFRL